MIKIDIISGFLGAGKTTFIKKLLQEAIVGEQVVLIENEFGEIGIDGGFLKDSGIEIREMNSGCICCSLVGDFEKSLKEVLTKYHPDRVIIEPSGVGKLSDVMKAVTDAASQLEVTLNSAVTIVDTNKCKMYRKNFGEFFNNQIENAGTVVLSRTDMASPQNIEQAVEIVRELNPKAAVVTTPVSELNGKQLMDMIETSDTMEEALMEEVMAHHEQEEACGCGCGCGHDHDHDHHHHHHHHEEACGCGCDHDHDHHHHNHDEECGCGCGHDHHHDADEVFTSWGAENVPPMRKEELDKILDELAYGEGFGDVLRAKGMIPGEEKGEWLYFDLVPEQYEIRAGIPEYTGKVCVIGANLKEEELKKAFKG